MAANIVTGLRLLLAAVLVLTASDLRAQTCAGGVSFNFVPLQVGGEAASSATAHAGSVTVGYGSDRLFGAVTAGVHVIRDGGGTASRLAVAVGADQPIRRDNRLHVCPTITASRTDSGTAADHDLAGHVAAGWVVRNSPGLTVVPSLGAGFGTSVRGGMDAAVGFIIRSRYAITPRLTVPWRGADETSIAVAFVIHVGAG